MHSNWVVLYRWMDLECFFPWFIVLQQKVERNLVWSHYQWVQCHTKASFFSNLAWARHMKCLTPKMLTMEMLESSVFSYVTLPLLYDCWEKNEWDLSISSRHLLIQLTRRLLKRKEDMVISLTFSFSFFVSYRGRRVT